MLFFFLSYWEQFDQIIEYNLLWEINGDLICESESMVEGEVGVMGDLEF